MIFAKPHILSNHHAKLGNNWEMVTGILAMYTIAMCWNITS